MRNATGNKVIRMLALNFVIITLLPPYYFRGAYTTLIHTRCGSSWFDRQSLDVLFGVPNVAEFTFYIVGRICAYRGCIGARDRVPAAWCVSPLLGVMHSPALRPLPPPARRGRTWAACKTSLLRH